jgi:hypothetical protein
MLNPDQQEGPYELHATQYTNAANSKQLHIGDVIHATWVPWTQTIELQGGDSTTIRHFNISDITLPASRKPPKPSPETDIEHFWNGKR